MSFPLVMHGPALLYEVGDDLEDDMVANYEANLEKVLSELPSPVTGGTMLTVEDLQQELACNINIKHREEFDEEKEPDGMVLSGLPQHLAKEKDNNTSTENGASTSNASEAVSLETKDDSEIEILPAGIESSPNGKKRKLPDMSDATIPDSSKNKLQDIDDDDGDDLVMLDVGSSDGSKKKRLQ